MSTMVYKTAFRARLPEIKDSHQHLEWFRKNVGEPTNVEEYEDRVLFSYDIDQNYRYVENTPPYFSPCFWEDDYGVELILGYSRDEMHDFKATLGEFLEEFNRICALPGVPFVEVIFVSYGWYNGSDEPIEWGKTLKQQESKHKTHANRGY